MPSNIDHFIQYAKFWAYFGAGAFLFGLSTLILMGIFAYNFNRFMTQKFLKEEISTFGSVQNLPQLDNEQKKLLHLLVFKWNRQEDKWYQTSSDALGKLISGENINLEDIKRIRRAAYLGNLLQKVEDVDQAVFNQFGDALKHIDEELSEKVRKRKEDAETKRREDRALATIIDEADIIKRQLTVSKWTAVGAIASAFAAMFSALSSYFNS